MISQIHKCPADPVDLEGLEESPTEIGEKVEMRPSSDLGGPSVKDLHGGDNARTKSWVSERSCQPWENHLTERSRSMKTERSRREKEPTGEKNPDSGQPLRRPGGTAASGELDARTSREEARSETHLKVELSRRCGCLG
ncbi:unnamed protein product [Microthlaspi erraticum]|uniref:Uncharacterized protein n=1 Tax=Microthlaspi erraticum TaxID=1685480 RepID=A0A6D2JYB6_9BRAS|nr:unnamed protein product [Microthlaspi erraticum]